MLHERFGLAHTTLQVEHAARPLELHRRIARPADERPDGKDRDRHRRLERHRRRDRALLAGGGAKVAGGARRSDQLETDVRLDLDVTDPESSKAFVDRAVGELGGLDILVNNAGLALGRDPVWDVDEEDERRCWRRTCSASMRMTRLCLPHIRDGGHIVNMGSVAGIWSYKSGSGYVASKHAVHGYTRALRDDLRAARCG